MSDRPTSVWWKTAAVRLFIVFPRLLTAKLLPDRTCALQRDAFTAASVLQWFKNEVDKRSPSLDQKAALEHTSKITADRDQEHHPPHQQVAVVFSHQLSNSPLLTWKSYWWRRSRGEDGGKNKDKMHKMAESMETRATGRRSVTFLFLFLLRCTDWLHGP